MNYMAFSKTILQTLEETSVQCPFCTGRLEILSDEEIYCPECGRFFEVAEKARENLFLKRGG